jgi:F-type H+-transporting ATPase subunit b
MGEAILRAASGGESPLGPLLPEPYDLVWSAVIFLVILFVVVRFGLPRMNKLLDERSAKIQGNIEQAEAAQREANAALERYNAQLAEARAEAGRIREQAREDGKRISAEIRERAEADAARITAQAQAQIEGERQSAINSLRAEVGTLALDLASGVIGQHLENDANATALVDRFLADLDLEKAPGGSSDAPRR